MVTQNFLFQKVSNSQIDKFDMERFLSDVLHFHIIFNVLIGLKRKTFENDLCYVLLPTHEAWIFACKGDHDRGFLKCFFCFKCYLKNLKGLRYLGGVVGWNIFKISF